MTRWEDRAACRGRDPAHWFDPYTVAYAQAVCASCPVRRPCLAGALRRREQYGVWGGVDLTLRAGKRVSVKTRRRLLDRVQ